MSVIFPDDKDRDDFWGIGLFTVLPSFMAASPRKLYLIHMPQKF